MNRNVLVAQSGGPSPVINASLLGVVDACRAYPDRFGRIYAGWHGIEGVLNEELLDLSAQPERELALLKTTPFAGAVGTCRYKLADEGSADFTRIIDVFRAHEIGYFYYIGGNDSMDTADKVSRLAERLGYPLVVTGIPKTIDNDVGDSAFQLFRNVGNNLLFFFQNLLTWQFNSPPTNILTYKKPFPTPGKAKTIQLKQHPFQKPFTRFLGRPTSTVVTLSAPAVYGKSTAHTL